MCIYTDSHTLRKMPRTVGTNPVFQKQCSDILKPMLFSRCWLRLHRKNMHKSSVCDWQKWHPPPTGKSKNLKISPWEQTTSVQITPKNTEQPQSNAEKRPLAGLSGEVSVGKSAESEVRRKGTLIIPWPKTVTEKSMEQNLGYHFLLVSLLTWKCPTLEFCKAQPSR